MAKNRQHYPDAPEEQQQELHDYIVVHPVERRGRLYQRRDVLRLSPEEAAGWLKQGYIQLATGN